MKIRFGLHLDGEHGWQPADQLNTTTTGPLGLLNLLETQLGLLHTSVSESERVVQFRECLKLALTTDRFYAKSFTTDELGTSASLLAWRDNWHLHGWTQPLNAVTSPRLRDMQAVEQFTQGRLALSVGERLQRVLDKIAVRRPCIESVELCEPLSHFPQRWQAVLQRLPLTDQATPPTAKGLLGKLQTALAGLCKGEAQGEAPAKLSWDKDGDGSIKIVRAETRTLAARWLAEHLRSIRTANEDALILAENHRSELDGVLASAGMAQQGFKEPSAFRPTLQVLPLALEQLWSPINIYGLLQFLTHPVCPVPSVARTRIAEKLARSPGIGDSPEWRSTLKNIEETCEKRGYDWKAAQESIAVWIERSRVDRNDPDGAPTEMVLSLLQNLTAYFRGRLATEDVAQRVSFNAALSQSLACQESVKGLIKQDVTHIRPRQLQKLVAQATARGSSNPLTVAELGAFRDISTPAAAIEPCDHVIWWQLAAGPLPKPYPWSKQEISDLSAAGIQLPSMDITLNQLAADWQKPIFAAQKTLTLVLPPEGAEVHPIWQMLETLFETHPPVTSLESILTKATPSIGQDPSIETITHKPLPARQRYWYLPKDLPIAKKDKESYSSLEGFLFNPYQWLLKYTAALKPSGILDISDSYLLYGNLAHNLAERLFTRADGLSMSDATFDTWFKEHFNDLISTEGVVLLMPGRGADLENFRQQIFRALSELRAHLKKADVVKVEPEVEVEGSFVGGTIYGFADLLVTRSDGKQAIVDLKWAGGKKYPDKLATNSHLQLAIYAELIRQKTGHWPEIAYFILSKSELLAQNAFFFPDAKVVQKKKGLEEEGTPQLWQRFQNTWKWRQQQIAAGEIELILNDADLADDLTQWPEDGLRPEVLNQTYNDTLSLAGWED